MVFHRYIFYPTLRGSLELSEPIASCLGQRRVEPGIIASSAKSHMEANNNHLHPLSRSHIKHGPKCHPLVFRQQCITKLASKCFNLEWKLFPHILTQCLTRYCFLPLMSKYTIAHEVGIILFSYTILYSLDASVITFDQVQQRHYLPQIPQMNRISA